VTKPEDLPYRIKGRQLIAEDASMRVQILTLEEGEQVPWHRHTFVTDTFICLDGPMVVNTRNPSATHILSHGETIAVDPTTAHQVTGQGGVYCRFVIVQSGGAHDYIPADDQG